MHAPSLYKYLRYRNVEQVLLKLEYHPATYFHTGKVDIEVI